MNSKSERKKMERILVVDDEIAICNLLRKFLDLKGYEVYTALDGPAAIAKVKEFRPHIVLLDIMMPGMGGIQVLKKNKESTPRGAGIELTPGRG
jgi:two-component system OmpR family response regulator